VSHYFFEVYTKGLNGETGWEIQVGFVLNAGSREQAVSRIKAKFGRRFDEVIQCHESGLFEIKGPKTVLHCN
jgi:hypothetical protein